MVSYNEKDIKLVDFDWAGKVNEVCYPYNVNIIDVEWPDTVQGLAFIQRCHDEEMLERIANKMRTFT